MLFPQKMRTMLHKEHQRFNKIYGEMLDKQRAIMEARGSDRDNESPIYIRRSPGENYGVASSKMLRIRSLLTTLDRNNPQTSVLKKLIEECLDVCNYLLFIAVLCSMVLEDEVEYVSIISEQEAEIKLRLESMRGPQVTVGIGPDTPFPGGDYSLAGMSSGSKKGQSK